MNLEEWKGKISFLTNTPSSSISLSLEKCSIALELLQGEKDGKFTFPSSSQFFMDFILEKELFRLLSLKDKTPSQTLLCSPLFWSIIDILFKGGNAANTSLPIITKPLIPVFTNLFMIPNLIPNPLVKDVLLAIRNMSSIVCKTSIKYMIEFIISIKSLNDLSLKRASLDVIIFWGKNSSLSLKGDHELQTLITITDSLKDSLLSEEVFDTFFFSSPLFATTLKSQLDGDDDDDDLKDGGINPINKELLCSLSIETKCALLSSFSKRTGFVRMDFIILMQYILQDLKTCGDRALILSTLNSCSFSSIQNDSAFSLLSSTIIPENVAPSFEVMIAILDIDLSLLISHLPNLLTSSSPIERGDLRDKFVSKLIESMSQIRQIPELIEFLIYNNGKVLFDAPFFDCIAFKLLKKISTLHKTVLIRLWDSLLADFTNTEASRGDQELRSIFLALLAYQPIIKEKALTFTDSNAIADADADDSLSKSLRIRINSIYCRRSDDITSLPSLIRRGAFTFLDDEKYSINLEILFKSSIFWESLPSINILLRHLLSNDKYYQSLKLILSLVPINLAPSFQIEASLAYELLIFILEKENNFIANNSLLEDGLLRLLHKDQLLLCHGGGGSMMNPSDLVISPLLKSKIQDKLGSSTNFLFTDDDFLAMEVWFDQMIEDKCSLPKTENLKMNPKTFLKYFKLSNDENIPIPANYTLYDKLFIASYLPTTTTTLRERLLDCKRGEEIDLSYLWNNDSLRGDQGILSRLMRIYPSNIQYNTSITYLQVLLKECPSKSSIFDDNIHLIKATPEEWLKIINQRLLAGGLLIGRLKEVDGLMLEIMEHVSLSLQELIRTSSLTWDLFRTLCSIIRLLIQYHFDNGPFYQDGKGILMCILIEMMYYAKGQSSFIRMFSKLIMDLGISLIKNSNTFSFITISNTIIIPIILNWIYFTTTTTTSMDDSLLPCCDEMKKVMIPAICNLLKCLDIYSSKLETHNTGEEEKFFKTGPFERLVQLTSEDTRAMMRQIITLYESDYKYEGKC